MSWIDQQTSLKAMAAPFNYFASHSGALNTTVPARCSLCRRLPGRRAAHLKVGGEEKNPKDSLWFPRKINEMKQEQKTIALVISIMIREMDQRETKRCIINLQDQLPAHCSATAGCSAPYKHHAVRMQGNPGVPPVQNQKQPVPQ